MPSIWILGMYNPSANAAIALPYVGGRQEAAAVVNDAYFGKVPSDRLKILPTAVLFKADGRYRSKIGLPPQRAANVAGSYDADRHALTVVQFTRPSGTTRYVNSMWEIQKDPFSGDVVNAYNDGPPAPGKPSLGPFYEVESSSPALSLEPGARYTHVHRTIHVVAPDAILDPIAQRVLHTAIGDIKAFQGR
jgi:hypothetical protein